MLFLLLVILVHLLPACDIIRQVIIILLVRVEIRGDLTTEIGRLVIKVALLQVLDMYCDFGACQNTQLMRLFE